MIRTEQTGGGEILIGYTKYVWQRKRLVTSQNLGQVPEGLVPLVDAAEREEKHHRSILPRRRKSADALQQTYFQARRAGFSDEEAIFATELGRKLARIKRRHSGLHNLTRGTVDINCRVSKKGDTRRILSRM